MHGAHPPGNRGREGGPNIAELNAKQVPILKETMKGNTLAVVHGCFAKKLLSEEEFTIYDKIKEDFRREYNLDPAADEVLLHELAFRCAKAHVSNVAGVEAALASHSNRISKLLQELDIRRDRRHNASSGQTMQQMIINIIQAAATATPGGEIEAPPAHHQLPPGRHETIDVDAIQIEEPDKVEAE
jgi:hypothetical protein